MPEPADQSRRLRSPAGSDSSGSTTPQSPPTPAPPGAPLGSGSWCREPFVQDNGSDAKEGKAQPCQTSFSGSQSPGRGEIMKLGQQTGRGVLPGAAYSAGLGWGSDVRCPRPHQPDLEGSRRSSIAIAGRGWGTCKGLVVGDAGLAEPGTLGRDPVEQAGGARAALTPPHRATCPCSSPCPLPPAPGSGSAQQLRSGAGLSLFCLPAGAAPNTGQQASCQACRGWHLPLQKAGARGVA